MKTISIYLLASLVFFPTVLFGQKKKEKKKNPISSVKILKIKIDQLGQKTIDANSLDNIQIGDFYQVQIEGINLNNYRVSIDSKDTILSSPLQFPSLGSISLDGLIKAITNIDQGGLQSLLDSNIQPGNSPEILTKSASLHSYIPKNQMGEALESQNPNKVNVDSLMKTIGPEFSRIGLQIKKINYDLDNWEVKLNIHKLNAYRSLVDESRKYPFDSALIEFQRIKRELIALKEKLISLNLFYKTFLEKNKKEILENPLLKKENEAIQKLIVELIKAMDGTQRLVSAENIFKALKPLVHLENNFGKSYISLPIELLKEQETLKVELSPIESNSHLPAYQTKIVFPNPSLNYQGVGLSLYVSGLYDEVYSSIGVGSENPEDTSLIYSFVDEEPTKFEMGTVTMLRLGKKTRNEKFGAHFSVGAGFSISDKIKPRFLGGGGITFGRKHMLAMDIGGILGFVERRSKVYENLKGPFLEIPENITVSKLQGHFFLSLGYVFKL